VLERAILERETYPVVCAYSSLYPSRWTGTASNAK
jgi:hypothetical protein